MGRDAVRPTVLLYVYKHATSSYEGMRRSTPSRCNRIPHLARQRPRYLAKTNGDCICGCNDAAGVDETDRDLQNICGEVIVGGFAAGCKRSSRAYSWLHEDLVWPTAHCTDFSPGRELLVRTCRPAPGRSDTQESHCGWQRVRKVARYIGKELKPGGRVWPPQRLQKAWRRLRRSVSGNSKAYTSNDVAE